MFSLLGKWITLSCDFLSNTLLLYRTNTLFCPSPYVYTSTLRGVSAPNRTFLQHHDGLSLVFHCLERVSPQHMTRGALVQMCRLVERLGSWSKGWADSAIALLLAPSQLWVFAHDEVKITLAGTIRGLTRRCPGRMRRVVGVQRCLDALDRFFWYTPPTCSSACHAGDVRVPRTTGAGKNGGGNSNAGSSVSQRWIHPSTGEVIGHRASGAALTEIRARLMDAVMLMACDGDGVAKADVVAVVRYLSGCRDAASRCEALRLVLRLMDDPHQAERFVVASGYVNEPDAGQDGVSSGHRATGEAGVAATGGNDGFHRGGAALAVLASLLGATDSTVQLLALVALGQVSNIG